MFWDSQKEMLVKNKYKTANVVLAIVHALGWLGAVASVLLMFAGLPLIAVSGTVMASLLVIAVAQMALAQIATAISAAETARNTAEIARLIGEARAKSQGKAG